MSAPVIDLEGAELCARCERRSSDMREGITTVPDECQELVTIAGGRVLIVGCPVHVALAAETLRVR